MTSVTSPSRSVSTDAYPLPTVERDEPGLQVPFLCLPGEGPQYIGRTQDGSVLVLTNYRLYHSGVSIPIRLIETVDVKDIFYLHISCKDARYLKLLFSNGDTCSEWSRRLMMTIAPPTQLDSLFAFAYAAWAHSFLPPAATDPFQDYYREYERLGFDMCGVWRISRINMEYRLCTSYPQLLVVPTSISDETLEAVARFRSARRIPTVVWRYRVNGAVIARSSQPEVGWLGWRSEHDEKMLAAVVAACNHSSVNGNMANGNTNGNGPNRHPLNKSTHREANIETSCDADDGDLKRLLIVDARSYASAVTNRARGGGCECSQYYTTADIQFLSLPNIHYVRKSFHSLRNLTADPDQPGWYGLLEKSLWLQVVGGLLRGACQVTRAILSGRPVLVHCSDGWDRTPQLTATAQLMLDPFYRTIQGFQTLVEREWLDFGHKFADRCGHAVGTEDVNERCPVFIQWLDCVHQIMKQYPCSFEFNEAFLVKLARHAHATLTGTFLCNTRRERRAAHISERTVCAWALLKGNQYRNPLYAMQETALTPESSMRALRLWTSLYVGSVGSGTTDGTSVGDESSTPPAASTPPPTASPSPHPPDNDNGTSTPPLHPHSDGLSKARSYGELLAELEEENGNVQRRSSDSQLNPNKHKNVSMLPSSVEFSKDSSHSPASPDKDLLEGYFGGSELQEEAREELSEHFSMEDSSSDQMDPSGRCIVTHKGHAKVCNGEEHSPSNLNGFHVNHYADDSVDDCPDNCNRMSHRQVPTESELTSNDTHIQRISKLSMNLATTKLRKETCVAYHNGNSDVELLGEEAVPMENLNLVKQLPLDDHSQLNERLTDCLFPEVQTYAETADSPSKDSTSVAAPVRCRNSSITWRSISESSQQTDSSGGCVDLSAEAAGWLVASPPSNPLPTHSNRRRLDSVHNGSLNDAAATLLEAEIGKLLSAEADSGGRTENGEDTTLCPNTPQHRISQGAVRMPRRNQRSSTRPPPSCFTNNNHSFNGNSWYDMSLERMSREECPCGSCTICGECCCCGPGDKALANSVDSSPSCSQSIHQNRSTQRVPCTCGMGPDGALDGVVDPIDGLSCPHSPIQARLHQIIWEHKMREEALSRELRAARAALVRRSTSPAVTAPATSLHHSPVVPTADASSVVHTPQNGGEDMMTISRCIADALMSDDQFPNFYDHFTVDGGVSGCERREGYKRSEPTICSVSGAAELWSACATNNIPEPECQRCRTEFWHGKRKHICRRCGGIFCGECSERWRGSPDVLPVSTVSGGLSGAAPAEECPFESHRVCLDCAASLTTKHSSCCLYVEESSRTITTLHDSPPQPSS